MKLDEWKKSVNEFCQREYGTDADWSTLEHVGVAYTEDDYGYPIQVYLDLNTGVIHKEIAGEHVDEMEVVPEDFDYFDFSYLVESW